MKNKKKEIETFLEISASLTGFNKAELEGTGMQEDYFQIVMDRPRPVSDPSTPTNAELFLAESAQIIKESKGDESKLNEAIATRLMPDASYNGLAKKIITMWYNSTWGSDVISPASYVQGLIWEAAQAHPPGAKQPGYGSWAIPPIEIPTK
jgi:hypothetical protein